MLSSLRLVQNSSLVKQPTNQPNNKPTNHSWFGGLVGFLESLVYLDIGAIIAAAEDQPASKQYNQPTNHCCFVAWCACMKHLFGAIGDSERTRLQSVGN